MPPPRAAPARVPTGRVSASKMSACGVATPAAVLRLYWNRQTHYGQQNQNYALWPHKEGKSIGHSLPIPGESNPSLLLFAVPKSCVRGVGATARARTHFDSGLPDSPRADRGPRRRELLSKCFAAGLLVAIPPLSQATMLAMWEQAESRRLKPTPPNDLGPFYKPQAPRVNRLSRPGDPGLPLSVSGTVFDVNGEALPNAKLEVWQADPSGHYDNEGFHYRGMLSSAQRGQYNFETNMPGHYPSRVAQHIHYKVTAPGHKTLVTQLYFATDPVFEGDPDRTYRKDPLVESRELVRPVRVFADPQSIHAAVVFEIVLERV